ncbi:mandelate racemase/muconate lactonizing enzyme family protein [Brucella pecoris]|uniref:Galactonate dehydratase n=1 Tax=Brucella pecoris TaxID=867683 RepID=A0A5C5CCC1_9HYPH|nr:mandelate racemase/muconate lactonizing enzyme family protein [Brucella pecoris]MBB4096036.1 galactonate dehydratase [Brucella pecoris]TNV08940.1 mandelate racemase/muconate lactonizing enzyme family protein [Brucella pecoris]
MKITSVNVYYVRGQGLKPVLVQVHTDEGISGLGEAAISYGSGGTAAAGMITDLSERFLLGGDPLAINRIVSDIYDQTFWLKNPGGIACAGMSAIEQALWDIRGKALNVPVYELFGGKIRDELNYYANGWYFGAKSKLDLIRKAADAVDDGHYALKMYPLAQIQPNGTLRHPRGRYSDNFDAVTAGIELVRDVRKAVGPDIRLMLDFGGGISVADTVRFCERTKEYDIEFVEEITDPGDLGALSQVAPLIDIPIAAGERHYLRHGFRDLLEKRVISILQPDIGNAGGFAEVHKIAAMADAYGLKVQPHVCGSSVAANIATHLSACLPNFYIQEHFPYWADIPGYIEVATVSFEEKARNGSLPVSEQIGFGVELNEAKMKEHLWAVIG